ncbi:15562_t:CDS:2, partial [Funneliformis geosporum]
DSKFVPYVTLKALKEAVSSTPAPSSSSTSTSVPTNLDLEIVQEVFGSLPEKTMEFEVFDISNIATPNNFPPVNRSKLLDPDEYLEDDDIKEDLKDFTVVTKATPFAAASHIKFTPKEKNNSKIILTINNIFAQNDEFRGVSVYHVNLTYSVIVYFVTSDVATAALHVTIPDLKINIFCNFSQYKADMQFNEKTIHVTDIPLQMKPANIKQVFAKYGTVTNFKMTVR